MIFEDRFLFEEGVYWTYTTDEKRNIDRKDEQRLPSYFLRITKTPGEHSWTAARHYREISNLETISKTRTYTAHPAMPYSKAL